MRAFHQSAFFSEITTDFVECDTAKACRLRPVVSEVCWDQLLQSRDSRREFTQLQGISDSRSYCTSRASVVSKP